MNRNKTEPEKYHFTTQAIEDDITYNTILSIDMDDEITELLTPITPDEEFEDDLLEEVNYETNNPHITGLKKLNTFKRETVTFVETMTAVDQKIYNEALIQLEQLTLRYVQHNKSPKTFKKYSHDNNSEMDINQLSTSGINSSPSNSGINSFPITTTLKPIQET